ncbi:hypothetical protein T492DRAFT_893958 [Pavlovales sp. CCMP2436]|nr:hypothetical protein T492DRAFT_893958 [Pavlovales sp. CCMP2436]
MGAEDPAAAGVVAAAAAAAGEDNDEAEMMRVIKLHSSDMEERERLKANILQDADLFDVVVTT